MPIKYDDGGTQKKIEELAVLLEQGIKAGLLNIFNAIATYAVINKLQRTSPTTLNVFTGNLLRSIQGQTSTGFTRIPKRDLSPKVAAKIGVGKSGFSKGSGRGFGVREIRKSGSGKWIGTFGTKVQSKGASGFDYPLYHESRQRPFLKPSVDATSSKFNTIMRAQMKAVEKAGKID